MRRAHFRTIWQKAKLLHSFSKSVPAIHYRFIYEPWILHQFIHLHNYQWFSFVDSAVERKKTESGVSVKFVTWATPSWNIACRHVTWVHSLTHLFEFTDNWYSLARMAIALKIPQRIFIFWRHRFKMAAPRSFSFRTATAWHEKSWLWMAFYLKPTWIKRGVPL